MSFFVIEPTEGDIIAARDGACLGFFLFIANLAAFILCRGFFFFYFSCVRSLPSLACSS